MLPRLLRIIWILTLLVWLAAAIPARAEAGVTLSTLRIELWPEYDRPAMLVILTGTLAPEVALPATVSVRIPVASGGPHAVAATDAQGALLEAAYTTSTEGDTLVVAVQAKSSTFHVEYYDPALDIQDQSREYTFQWTPDFAVADATLQVQEPVGSQGLTAFPALTPLGAGSLGLNYYGALLGPLSAGQTVAFKLSYTKSDSTLSSAMVGQTMATQAALATESVANAPSAASGIPSGGALSGLGTGIVVALVVAAAGLLAFGLWRARSTAGRQRSISRTTVGGGSPESGKRFCTKCGHPAIAGDRFCRVCGAALPSH